MPKQRRRRQKTGNHRKVPIRQCQEQYRWKRGLDTLNINFRDALQTEILYTTKYSQDIQSSTALLLAQSNACLNPVQKLGLSRQAERLILMNQTIMKPICDYYIDIETQLCDITPLDDAANHDYGPKRNRIIAQMDDYTCRRYTRFSKQELQRIFHMFNIGYRDIKIKCSSTQNNSYTFTSEEIFLFSLAKIATGDSTDKLCCDLFGGSPRRWSGAYKWFLYYVHDRYIDTVLGMPGLQRVRDRFPEYSKKIARKFNQERFYLENHTLNRININSTTVDENDFAIPFFAS